MSQPVLNRTPSRSSPARSSRWLRISPFWTTASAAILGHHRLVAVLEIDDGQTPRGQRDRAVEVDAAAVRTPVDKGLVHPLDHFAVGRLSARKVVAAADAAHVQPEVRAVG